MITYVAKRLLLFLPTIFVITLLVFAISQIAPGDPVLILNADLATNTGLGDLPEEERIYRETAARLGIDKPLFYLQVSPAAYPDTLYRVLNRAKRTNLRLLAAKYGYWPAVQQYYESIVSMERRFVALPDSIRAREGKNIINNLDALYILHADRPMKARISNLEKALREDVRLGTQLSSHLQALQSSYLALAENARPLNCFIPVLHWHGPDNQYHHWLVNCLRGDFGNSLRDGLPVAGKIWKALGTTLLLNGFAVFFIFMISIPLGVHAAVNSGKLFDRINTVLLFALYSLPTFWIGTMLIIFVTTDEYGMDWFPTLGLKSSNLPADASYWTRLVDKAHHMVLPVFCLTYGSLAFVSRQMRNSMQLELNKPYIKTAYAKGLSRRQVIWKHAYRNALFPIITLIASIFPFLLAGSFIVELIFNISGMGWLMIQSIFARDWPVVYGILVLSSLFTILGILVADVLYKATDPRIDYK